MPSVPIPGVVPLLAIVFGAGLALAAAGVAANAAYTAWVRRRFPARGERVPFAGATLHVVRRGTGPPVLLVHGMNGTAHEFPDALLDDLARDHAVLALDRPGHGGSGRGDGPLDLAANARAVLAVLATVAGPATLVGYSYGAAVALRAALDAPERVARVVVLSPCTVVDARNRAYTDLPLPPGRARALALRIGTLPVGLVLARFTRRDAWHPLEPPRGFDAVRAWAFVPSQLEAALENFHTLAPDLAALARDLPRLAPPLAVLVGRDDRVTPAAAHAEWLPRVVRGATLRTFEGVGHWLPRQRPADVAAAVREVEARR